ncbi:MAG TPA: tRNA/rRNA methyltransferase [Bacteroidales bacterium]|nr:tRNA/rRNA methyltransferase [Bacteroidales bacterium]
MIHNFFEIFVSKIVPMDLNFILVEPGVPENIGASARAIKTMGFSRLSLVNPCEYLGGKARWVAHGSSDLLDKAIIFNSLADAVAEVDLVIGTTAKQRITKHDYIPAGMLASVLESKELSGSKVAIVFGREESGLTNEELTLCDLTSSVPMVDNYPSLNLSQAVMIYAWELASINLQMEATDYPDAADSSVRSLKSRIIEIMQFTGMKLNDPLLGRIFERVSLAGQKDINLMHSILASLAEALKAKNK